MSKGVLYAAISFKDKILVQSTFSSGDFDFVIVNILQNINLSHERTKFNKDNSLFYILHNTKDLNIIISCDNDFDEDEAFKILSDIRTDFLANYPNEWISAESYAFQHDYESQITQIVNRCKNMSFEPIESISMDKLESSIASPLEYEIEAAPGRSRIFEWKLFILRNWCELLGGLLLLALFLLLIGIIFW